MFSEYKNKQTPNNDLPAWAEETDKQTEKDETKAKTFQKKTRMNDFSQSMSCAFIIINKGDGGMRH